MGIIDLLKKNITQQELLNYYNANISYEYLPKKIEGCVFSHKGIYVIIINDYLSYYKKKKTILHELAHIELCQLEQIDRDMLYTKIEDYEDNADKYIKFLMDIMEEK